VGGRDPLATAARSGDEVAFAALAQQCRRELHVHCYGMLASFDQAEGVVQETLVRAWKKRASFEGRTTFRAWLYRIATNACLDVVRRTFRQRSSAALITTGRSGGLLPLPDITWPQPYPDPARQGRSW
jgi:RNA polymerase sigma-70 factor (ECF subfamily)